MFAAGRVPISNCRYGDILTPVLLVIQHPFLDVFGNILVLREIVEIGTRVYRQEFTFTKVD